MRVRLFPATAPIAPKSAPQAASRRFAGAASTLVIAVVLGLASGADAASRNRVTIDDSVLESLGPEPSVASLMLKPPRGAAASSRGIPGPAPRAIAEAPSAAPKSRLLIPGGSQAAPASPAPQIAAAPVLRLPPMTSVAAAPAVRPAPAEAPRSRMVSAPSLTPPSLTPPSSTPLASARPILTPPAPQPMPQLALAPPVLTPPAPAPLLPTPPVAPMASGVRAAPSETPRSQLLLPPVMGERAPPPPVQAPAPVAAAPSSWPSLAGSAVAAPLPATAALPPPPPAAPPVRQQAAAATPNARDIQPPAPSAVPAVAPSAAPPSSAAKPAAIGARLLFQRGTLDPADGSREALARLAAQLAATPNRRVTIMSYALGASGETENSNDARRLSLDRALAVRSGLVQQGVRSTQVTVRALGNPGGEGPPDRVDILLLDE